MTDTLICVSSLVGDFSLMVCLLPTGFSFWGTVMVADRRGVNVVHGANEGEFEVAGETVGRVRSALVHAFNIPDDAIALANGRRVSFGYIAQAGDVIEFVVERGDKGGRKKAAAATPDDDDEQPVPDLTAMSLDGLAAFIDGRLASSHEAQQRSLLQAHKSAVDLFWAGAALFEARAKCEQEGRGRWKEFKGEHGFKHTTVNDAIRLFENAKTPDALIGLGITEAKNKFVYPPKEAQPPKPGGARPTPRTPKGAAPAAKPQSNTKRPDRLVTDDEPDEDEIFAEAEEGNTVVDPADAIAEALEDIAQQLNEIAQDHLGKVDLTQPVPARLKTAIHAVVLGIANIHRRINREQPNS